MQQQQQSHHHHAQHQRPTSGPASGGPGTMHSSRPTPAPAPTPNDIAASHGFKFKVEVPSRNADDDYGGCRLVDATYERVKQIGEGTYGQVRAPWPVPLLPGCACLPGCLAPLQGFCF